MKFAWSERGSPLEVIAPFALSVKSFTDSSLSLCFSLSILNVFIGNVCSLFLSSSTSPSIWDVTSSPLLVLVLCWFLYFGNRIIFATPLLVPKCDWVAQVGEVTNGELKRDKTHTSKQIFNGQFMKVIRTRKGKRKGQDVLTIQLGEQNYAKSGK